MKLRSFMRVIGAVTLSVLLTGIASADEAQIRKAVGEAIPGVPIRAVSKAPIPGNLFELNGRRSLTAQRVEELQ